VQPTAEAIREFVRQTLGWHKAPLHVFWLRNDEDFPRTGSGKIKKHVLSLQGQEILKKASQTTARL
jgi:long-chain acyl-CoA synthetase